jgi:sugar lactone lactonase YvrE
MNRIRIPSAMSLGALAALGLGGMPAQAVSPTMAMPAALASAQSYVATQSSKPGVKLLGGTLQGAGKPIALSVITIYAAGTSGYGKASIAGFGFSDENGAIHAAYIASGAQQLYLVAKGGVVGNSNTYDNAIGLSAPLGSFAAAPGSVRVNEVTTVAAAYALSGFLDSSGQAPGTSATNVTGLTNAVSLFANLASVTSGSAATSLASGAFGTPPTATVNTLANILAACIGSGSGSSSQCTSLFSAATPPAGSAPTNTLAAAVDIARNEGNNVAALFALAAGPFQPALTTAPNDWSLAISYTGGALDSGSAVNGLAIDAAGNAWVSSVVSDPGVNGGNGFLVRLNPRGVQGAALFDNGNIVLPSAVAVDAAGHIWVANTSDNGVNGGNGSVSGLFGSGASISGSPFFGGGVVSPVGLAPDAAGNIWVLSGAEPFVTELPIAASYAGTTFTVHDGGAHAPSLTALAVDNAGNVYVTDGAANLLVGLSAANPAQQISGSPFSGGGLDIPFGLAIDGPGSLWAANTGLQGVTKFVASGGTFSAVQFLSNDLVSPGPVAIDSAGNVWLSNEDFNGVDGVVPLSNSGIALAGSAGQLVGGGTVQRQPTAVAVDASGNVWLGGGFGQNVIELVGAAKPTRTPLVGQPQLP